MKKRIIKIGWDISHLEFTISDHYYFSKLKTMINSDGSHVREISIFYELEFFDVIVLNYPEIAFTDSETDFLYHMVNSGKRVIITGYYNNEDNIADTVNTLSIKFGVSLNKDGIENNICNESGDPLLPVITSVTEYNKSVSGVMLPCCASIEIIGDNVRPFLFSESGKVNNKDIMGTITYSGKGEFILIGTCVFWDNFAISKYSNSSFSVNMLKTPLNS